MNELKVGDTVVATKKKLYPETWETFKEGSNYLQVGKVVEVRKKEDWLPKRILVVVHKGSRFIFLKEELIKVE